MTSLETGEGRRWDKTIEFPIDIATKLSGYRGELVFQREKTNPCLKGREDGILDSPNNKCPIQFLWLNSET